MSGEENNCGELVRGVDESLPTIQEASMPARNYCGDNSAFLATVKLEPVETKPDTEEDQTIVDLPFPASKGCFEIPGSRSWSWDRTEALVARACATGVRGVDGDCGSLSDQRFVQCAQTWVHAINPHTGVRARFLPLNGPAPGLDPFKLQLHFSDWDLPEGCFIRFMGSKPHKTPGLRFYEGNLQALGFPNEALSAFHSARKQNERFEVFSLQWMRISTLQAVAVEDLLKTIRDRLEGTVHYDALLPAIEDVADLTALQCNRAAAASYTACREVRRAVLDVVDMPLHLRTHYEDAPFSTKLFDGPPHPSAPFPARRPDGNDHWPDPGCWHCDDDEYNDVDGIVDGVKRRRRDGSS